MLTLLKKKELIDETVVENILSWTHSGFSVWAGDTVSPEDTDALLFLPRYIDRGPVAGNRISITDDIITYETERDEITHEFSAVEFLARLTPHVPLKWESTTRYYGEYSHRRRGERKKNVLKQTGDTTSLPLPSPIAKKKASRTWAALIKKVYEVDPLVCKKCGGIMKIVAFLQDPHEVKCLLLSLKLPDFHPPPPITAPCSEEPVFEPLFDDFDALVQ